MNDEEIRLIKGYFNDGYCCDLDELKNIANKMIKENNQLQSNWNSLREWLEKQKHDAEICKEWNRKNNFNDIDYERDIKRFDFVLDKMNELEGKDMK